MTEPAPLTPAELEPKGDALSEAMALHDLLRSHDWYDLAGTDAERSLHERLTRLVSCEEFPGLIASAPAKPSHVGVEEVHVMVPVERIEDAIRDGQSHTDPAQGRSTLIMHLRDFAALRYAQSAPPSPEGWVKIEGQGIDNNLRSGEVYAAGCDGKIIPGVFVRHRVPAEATHAFAIPVPPTAPEGEG